MNVRELIDLLEDHDDDAEVRLAIQPSWPLQFEIADVVGDLDSGLDIDKDETTVWITQGAHPSSDSPYAPGFVYGD